MLGDDVGGDAQGRRTDGGDPGGGTAGEGKAGHGGVSIRLLEVDEDSVCEQEHADHREEEHRVAQLDETAHDRVEMREEAERYDGAQHALERLAGEDGENERRAAHGEEEAALG